VTRPGHPGPGAAAPTAGTPPRETSTRTEALRSGGRALAPPPVLGATGRAPTRRGAQRPVVEPDVTRSPEPGLTPVLHRNIDALRERRSLEEREKSRPDRISDRITRFTGSMRFVCIHVALFGTWILWNLPFSPLPRFDPSLVVLAMAASVEAIFLSTFVLISQNRMAALADRRAELDLQVSLLAEHEITRLIRLVKAIGDRLGVEEAQSPDLQTLERDVKPEAVLDHIDDARRQVEADVATDAKHGRPAPRARP
jgi:uncharacterized membrane protein